MVRRMVKQRILITLISSENARKGYKFLFEGMLMNECKTCSLSRICIGNLEKGRVYEVINVRGKKHRCKAFNIDLVVVEVKEAEIEAAIHTSLAMEGAIITFKPVNCSNISCNYYELCNPVGLKNGDKCKIIRIFKKLECPRKLPLTKVLISRYL